MVVGSMGTVVVDQRFDCGYFVTVNLGQLQFKGQSQILEFPILAYICLALEECTACKKGLGV